MRIAIFFISCLSLLSASAAELKTATAEQILVPRVFRLDGVVEAVNQSTISAQTSGQIETIW